MNSRAAFWSILIFGGARVLGWLRVSEELELKGMDIDKHGEAAYPAQVTIKVSNANGFYLRSIQCNKRTDAHNSAQRNSEWKP